MKKERSMKKSRNGLVGVLVVAVLALTVVSGYLFRENRDLNNQLTLTTEQKNAQLIEEVNTVYDLPEEQPVVAVVTNPDDFKTEYPTFDNVVEGDYLLFFRKARLNVLYRQSDKKVVQTATVAVPIAVEVVGTQSAIDDTKDKLAEFGNQIAVTSTVLDGVTQSFVFDIDGDQGAEAQSIAQQVGYDVGSTLPTNIAPGTQTEIVIAVSDSGGPPKESDVEPEEGSQLLKSDESDSDESAEE